MKNEHDYIIEILERVKGLETMLRDYEELEDNTDEAKAIAMKAREEVAAVREQLEAQEQEEHTEEKETRDSKQWSKRTMIAALISMALMLIGNIAFTLLKIKFGW